jgi:hypothetical protein
MLTRQHLKFTRSYSTGFVPFMRSILPPLKITKRDTFEFILWIYAISLAFQVNSKRLELKELQVKFDAHKRLLEYYVNNPRNVEQSGRVVVY